MGRQEEWGAKRLLPKSWPEGVMNSGVRHQDRAHRVGGGGTGFWEGGEFSFEQAEFEVPGEYPGGNILKESDTLQIDLRRLDIFLSMIIVLWLFFKVCIFCRKYGWMGQGWPWGNGS